MATITASPLAGVGDKLVTEITLTASNTMPGYVQGKGQILRLRNATAGALTPLITGSLAVAETNSDAQVTVNYAAGWTCQAIPAGAVRDIYLDRISKYLKGAINIANATGIIATLIEPS